MKKIILTILLLPVFSYGVDLESYNFRDGLIKDLNAKGYVVKDLEKLTEFSPLASWWASHDKVSSEGDKVLLERGEVKHFSFEFWPQNKTSGITCSHATVALDVNSNNEVVETFYYESCSL